MLLKLLKYDLRAMMKHFSLVWGLALGLAAVSGIFSINSFWSFNSSLIHMAARFAPVALIAIIVGMFVIAMLFVIRQFSRGLLGDEGYLMHTLPVRSWQLVLSKLICALCAFEISGVVTVLAFLLMIFREAGFLLSSESWDGLFSVLSAFIEHLGTAAYMGEFGLLLTVLMALGISTVYLAITVGHLVPRRRGLASAAVFIGIYVAINFYGGWVTDLFVFPLESHAGIWSAMAVIALPAALCLTGTSWLLEHKLNLD